MRVLGIAESHGSSACLMQDGEVIGMLQEERLTKRKNQVAFPRLAIQALADTHIGGDVSQIDRVVLAENWIDPYAIALDRHADFTIAQHVDEQHKLWYPHFYGEQKVDFGAYWTSEFRSGRCLNSDHNYDFSFLGDMDWEAVTNHFSEVERPNALKRHFGWTGEIATVDHHTCHAHYAFYGGPSHDAENTLVLTADAWGEDRNWSAWLPQSDGTLVNIGGGQEHSVARIYKFVTLILGMKPNEHEYKVMGLAPYSRSPKHIAEAERVFYEALDFRDGAFVSDRPLIDSYFDLKNRLEGHRFDNIAAALQNWTSGVTQAWAKHWLAETDRRILCFSGGLSMNIRLNGDLAQMKEVDFLSVPASGGDETLSAGACIADSLKRGERIRPIKHVYLGPAADFDDWPARLGETDMTEDDFSILTDVTDADVAAMLASNLIVARCVGPAEFGARALGNRSILANPKHPGNVKTINDAIKNRDFWMPFTPSILAEHADALLVNSKQIASPFMTIGFDTTEEAQEFIPGALHFADASARPQSVDRETNPEYWALIDAFRKITGIPAVLNTSLNLHGEPMNYSVADAARTVALSELQFLALPGNRLLFKRAAAQLLEKAIRRTTAAA